jgi:cytochrome c oxidase cbb3-type subunit I/II
MLYYMVPRLWKTELFSNKLANLQFWTSTIGLILYIISMWVAGITQGLMWRAVDATGKLVYPNFVETVTKIVPMYWVRAFGGVFVLFGFIILVYNLWQTIRRAPKSTQEDVFQAPSLKSATADGHAESAHRKLEGLPMVFTVLSLIAILVGSAIELLPAMMSSEFIMKDARVQPYTALEVAGRDVYVKEGCYVCHSQMVRPRVDEVLRYGRASEASEYVYDRPFQWGSRRIGPDLHRVGGKYNHMWHFRHMINPREVTQGSLMPEYKWLATQKYDVKVLPKKLKVLKGLGAPYSDEQIDAASENAQAQALQIATELNKDGVEMAIKDSKMVALIAYLQRLGRDTAPVKGE